MPQNDWGNQAVDFVETMKLRHKFNNHVPLQSSELPSRQSTGGKTLAREIRSPTSGDIQMSYVMTEPVLILRPEKRLCFASKRN
jgi:hypothetical protein